MVKSHDGSLLPDRLKSRRGLHAARKTNFDGTNPPVVLDHLKTTTYCVSGGFELRGAGDPEETSNRDDVPHLLFSPGAGVTPAEGCVKPTAGFTFDKVIYPSPAWLFLNRAGGPINS
jgi:hypothetical protein